jgi:hypothetical protein
MENSIVQKEKKTPYLATELTDKERQMIAKRAGATRRRNNAIMDRFSKAMHYKLLKGKGINEITDNLIATASDPENRNYMEAVRLILEVTGIKQDAQEQNQTPQISGENVQIVFADGTDRFAR